MLKKLHFFEIASVLVALALLVADYRHVTMSHSEGASLARLDPGSDSERLMRFKASLQ